MSCETKMELRSFYRRAVMNLSAEERERESALIRERIRNLPLWKKAETVLLYAPLRGEPDILPLLDELLTEGRTAVFPRCDDEAGHMSLYRVLSQEELKPGSWGILEPPAEPVRRIQPEAVDLALVPAVALDREGVRLGNGGGYYDRLLPRISEAILTGFTVQMADKLPREPHDVRVQGYVLPDRTMIWSET